MQRTYERTYDHPHEMLPYDIERTLPPSVVDHIYRFLIPVRLARYNYLTREINDKVCTYRMLLEEKRLRLLERKKQQEQRQRTVDALARIIETLEKSLDT